MYGWAGKILRVNLDDGSVTKEDTSKYLNYTGGIGFGYKVIFDEAPTAGPFDPENRIIFAVGPLTGSLAPSSGRSEVISISPHVYAPKSKNPLVTRSGFGGYWGAELKFAGYDAIVVQGKARKPVFINVVDDEVDIMDASGIWGKDTFEAQEMIKAKTGDEKTQIAVIGPSGERLVRISPIMHRIGNAAGQGGFGAVMGSKNLKAIAVRGTKGVQVADKKNLIKYVKSVREFQPGPPGFHPAVHRPAQLDRKARGPQGHQQAGPALRPDRELRAVAEQVPRQVPVLLLMSPGLLRLHERGRHGRAARSAAPSGSIPGWATATRPPSWPTNWPTSSAWTPSRCSP